VNGKSASLDQFRTLRTDSWWLQPLLVFVGLGGFVIYATWAALQDAHYLSRLSLAILFTLHLGELRTRRSADRLWWNLSPRFLVLWVPGGFRATCYILSQSLLPSFFALRLPARCVTRQELLRAKPVPFCCRIFTDLFHLSLVILAFLWWGPILAFVSRWFRHGRRHHRARR
jgi:hypothetical protein